MSHSGETVILTDLSRTNEISACAPIIPFRTGNVSVLYEGVISSNARLEITLNRNGYINTIPLPAGEVSGIYGGGEEWEGHLSVRYVPSGTVHGTLKITAVCGRRHTREEWNWYSKLNEQQRRK